jgi:hypothetical protein
MASGSNRWRASASTTISPSAAAIRSFNTAGLPRRWPKLRTVTPWSSYRSARSTVSSVDPSLPMMMASRSRG